MFAFVKDLFDCLFEKPKQPTTLLSLPAELRLPVYDQIFSDGQCIILTPETPSNPIKIHPILQANQHLRNEALLTFFSNIELILPTFLRSTPQERLPALLAKLLPGQLEQIPRISIIRNQRFELVIQFTKNPAAKVQEEDALADGVESVDFYDPVGVAMGAKFYIHVRSCRPSVSEEFCEKFAEVLSKAMTCLLESEAREEGAYLNNQDLCWLMAQLNRHAEQMMREICGTSRLFLVRENPGCGWA